MAFNRIESWEPKEQKESEKKGLLETLVSDVKEVKGEHYDDAEPGDRLFMLGAGCAIFLVISFFLFILISIALSPPPEQTSQELEFGELPSELFEDNLEL